jgi:DNA polymerase-3 subunit epsilon
MRQIILDTETTGLEPSQGHRIIEIGCVELINRRLTGNHYHQYLQPDREIDAGAIEVHGISNAFLSDKPRFADIVDDFIAFITDAELIIHNAPFDLGFINHELALTKAKWQAVEQYCIVLDTLVLARKMYPGQRNSLDALCKRHGIDNSQRDLHGALLDAEILADVYLAMTGGQGSLVLGSNTTDTDIKIANMKSLAADRPRLAVIRAGEAELQAHKSRLESIARASDGHCLWQQLDSMPFAD